MQSATGRGTWPTVGLDLLVNPWLRYSVPGTLHLPWQVQQPAPMPEWPIPRAQAPQWSDEILPDRCDGSLTAAARIRASSASSYSTATRGPRATVSPVGSRCRHAPSWPHDRDQPASKSPFLSPSFCACSYRGQPEGRCALLYWQSLPVERRCA